MTSEFAGALSRTCPTCQRPQPADAFYGTATECKDCKKSRSRDHRSSTARKVELLDRLAAALEELADQGWTPDALLPFRPQNVDA